MGEALTRRVIVSGNKPFKILSVEGAAEVSLSDSAPAANGTSQTVTLKIQPARPRVQARSEDQDRLAGRAGHRDSGRQRDALRRIHFIVCSVFPPKDNDGTDNKVNPPDEGGSTVRSGTRKRRS